MYRNVVLLILCIAVGVFLAPVVPWLFLGLLVVALLWPVWVVVRWTWGLLGRLLWFGREGSKEVWHLATSRHYRRSEGVAGWWLVGWGWFVLWGLLTIGDALNLHLPIR
jgi:hypothetical protein